MEAAFFDGLAENIAWKHAQADSKVSKGQRHKKTVRGTVKLLF